MARGFSLGYLFKMLSLFIKKAVLFLTCVCVCVCVHTSARVHMHTCMHSPTSVSGHWNVKDYRIYLFIDSTKTTRNIHEHKNSYMCTCMYTHTPLCDKKI